ncbi:MAG: A24 family peptidase [Pseudomonadota bacterium]|nr:A24 family peptidase [Pseudomonadota bacterium]
MLPAAIIFLTAMILICLWVIDMRVRLLPNIYVLSLALCGIAWQLETDFVYVQPLDMLYGAGLGAGSLLLIRFFANWYYKQDALGLGDVKLMGAVGLWLGAEGVLIALTLGAFAGVLHGLISAYHRKFKTGGALNLSSLELPAGPGFIIGSVLSALIVMGMIEGPW